MKAYIFLFFIAIIVLSAVGAQDYAEYARGRKKSNKGLIFAGALSGIVGGMVGSYITSSRLKAKHNAEKLELMKYIQYQDELYKQTSDTWQQEYTKLYKAYEELENDTLERDYEEFKAPDADGDDVISRTEFDTYVKKYLSSFPELSDRDFPKFEEFDLNSDGKVTFEEWQTFLHQQKLKEQAGSKNAVTETNSNSAYNELLNALYESTNQADSFNSLQKNAASKARGVRGRVGA